MVIIIYYGKHLKSFSCCWVTSCSNEDLVLKRASGQIVSSRYGSCFWLHCYALTCGAKGERTNTTFQNLNTLTNLIWTVFCGIRTVSFQFTYVHVPLFLKYILIFFLAHKKGFITQISGQMSNFIKFYVREFVVILHRQKILRASR